MRDFFGEAERRRQYVLSVCRRVFERYGFEPLETPALEELGLLAKKGAGGADVEGEIYSFKDKGGRELGMRFDLTVPLARFVASNPQLTKPFKRYAVGKVWRYDRPQKGRYREFMQADADIVGVAGMLAEFEVLASTVEVFNSLGLEFFIRVNNRALLEGLAKSCGVPAGKVADCLRCIDKQDKLGWKGVCREFKGKKINEKIVAVLEKGGSLDTVAKIVGEKNTGVKAMRELLALLEEAGLGRYVKFDASLARGLEYYTGSVFEVMVAGVSCGGGGRYDGLVKLYGGQDTPAVGISYGIDRLVDAAGDKIGMPVRAGKVLVAAVGGGPVQNTALKIAAELRAAAAAVGVEAVIESDLLGRNISKNLEYANKRGFTRVVVVGERELKTGKVTVKDMQSGKEQMVARKDIAGVTG